MPFTMAIRQAPMVWKTDLIYVGVLVRFEEGWGGGRVDR